MTLEKSDYLFVKLYVPCRDESTKNSNEDLTIEIVARFKNRESFEMYECCSFDELVDTINNWLRIKYPKVKYFIDGSPDYDILQNITEYDIHVEE
jgi:hypothetical protein